MISEAELCRSQLTRTLYHNAGSLSSVWRQFLKKYFGDFFGLGGGQFFSLNVAWVFNTKGKLKWKERRERKKEGREKRNKEKKRFIKRKENIFVYI